MAWGRMAASVLLAENLTAPAGKYESIQQMIQTAFNSPLTSSAGRLFDAVAAILGLCDIAEYEAQGAIRLESIADPSVTDRYEVAGLDFGPAIRAMRSSTSSWCSRSASAAPRRA